MAHLELVGQNRLQDPKSAALWPIAAT